MKRERSDIVREATKWVQENQGLYAKKEGYQSPRVSSELPDCSMPLTFDQYNFCSYGCLYCFAYFFKSNNPVYKDKGIPLRSVRPERVIRLIEGKPESKREWMFYNHFFKRKFLFHWGGLADPFCNFEIKNRNGIKIIEALGAQNYPCLFSFKGKDIFSKQYIKIFERYADQSNFAFQVSIVTNSDKVSSQIEIGAPSTSKRIEAIQMLSDMGYWTILRLRPFIIGVTDHGLTDLLNRALEAGINGVSVEWFAMDMRANESAKLRFEWLGKAMGVDNLHNYYKTLSPSERGGYMRLNRKVKEESMKIIYKFCAENNLVCGVSDPDFKELNTSGSCCAMPDKFPKNRLLENWTRNQLTYHLKRARKIYHKKGKIVKLTFHKVYGEESYLEDPILTQDHVRSFEYPMALRSVKTLRHILQETWNNLESPSNPRNYLHGKIIPIGCDDQDNLIYVYEPMAYEQEWKDEGIDLTR